MLRPTSPLSDPSANITSWPLNKHTASNLEVEARQTFYGFPIIYFSLIDLVQFRPAFWSPAHYITLHFYTLTIVNTLNYTSVKQSKLYYNIVYYVSSLDYNTLHFSKPHYIKLHYNILHIITRQNYR